MMMVAVFTNALLERPSVAIDKSSIMHVVGGRRRGRAVKYYIYSDPSAAPDRLAIDQSDLSNSCPAKEI